MTVYPMRLSIYLILIFVSIIFFVANTCAQSGSPLRTIQEKLRISVQDTVKADLLIEMGRYYVNKPGELAKDMDSALLFNGQARRLSSALSYNAGIDKSILLESHIYREKGNKSKAMELAESALQFAIQHHLIKETADAYLGLADFYGIEDNELAGKIKHTEKAIPLYEKGGFKREEAGAKLLPWQRYLSHLSDLHFAVK
jgi:tetratricopeptide (TPR) repeat protein